MIKDEERAVIDIVAVPRSGKSSILFENGGLRVRLNSPPEDGKANEECIRLFAKALRLPKSAVSIIKGERSRHKRLAVSGISSEELAARLRASN